MSSDAPPAEPIALSPRAGVALLTLQLRAAQREAAEAESEEADWDLEASIAHLRSRLAPRVDDRRRALDDEMAQERTAATQALAAAREQAASIVAAAEAEAAQLAAAAAREAAEAEAEAEALVIDIEPSDEDLVVGDLGVEVTDAEESSAPVAEVEADRATDEQANVASETPTQPVDPMTADTVARLTALRTLVDELLRASASGSSVPGVVTAPPESASIKVVIDADSFSKAFSTAISSMMDERLAMHRAQQEAWMTAPWRVVPAAAAPPPKKSFWANAWHADVLLSVLAMVIVIVVLVAWST